jgi:signal transduction histidine kinase
MGKFTIIRPRSLILALACAAAAAMVLVSEESYRHAVGALDSLGAMVDARANIQSLRWATFDAQIAAREFLLTGRDDYLLLHDDAQQRIGRDLLFLDRYYADAAAPQAVLQALHALTQSESADFARLRQRRAAGGGAAASEPVSRAAADDRIDAVRARSAELLALETANVADSRRNLYRSLMLGRAGIAALSMLSLLAVVLVLRNALARKRGYDARQNAASAERDALERMVVQRTQQLTDLTRHLQSAREDERNRLARDMHDELGALLTSAKLDAARLKSRLPTNSPEALERLEHLVATLNHVIALKRRIIEDLRPSALANLGLVPTLEILAREFAQTSGIAVHCALTPVSLGPSAELVAYRMVQEAITNITKYAKARNVWLCLSRDDDGAQISVHDDGIGFDPSRTGAAAHGLMGMRFRVEAEGGVLSVQSAPGHDTRILARLPERGAVPA